MPESDFELAVIGQGLVGASFVLALHHQPATRHLRVLHVDALADALATDSADQRHLALNAHSLDCLQKIGVALPLAQCSPIKRVHISRDGDFGRVLLGAAEEGVESFGRLVPASALRSGLRDALMTLDASKLERRFDSKLIGMDLHADGYALRLQSGEASTAHTRFVVGADGTDSAVRAQMALFEGEHRQDDELTYEQQALSFNAIAEYEHAGTAYERFTDHGPIAVLPLPNRRIGVIWTLPTEQAQAALQKSDTEFLAQFQSAFGYRLGRLMSPGKRTLWPLKRMRANPDVGPRCALIGNAAQTIHPLGAQGFNLGLRDAMALAKWLEQNGLDDLKQSALTAFSILRVKDRLDTLRFSDSGLVATQNPSLPARALRQLAWGAFETLPLAKRSLSRFGLGRSRGAL
jgi:2-octaprenyl-6-methoxyphenol hydroxylase